MSQHAWDLRCDCPPLHLPRRISRKAAHSKAWRRTSLGRYVPVDADRGVVEQRVAEESGRLPAGGAVTGWAALRLHGANLLDGTSDGRTPLPVPLVVPAGKNIAADPGVIRRRARVPDADLTSVQGVPCTTPRRALLDAIDLAGDWREAVAVIDQALATDLVDRASFSEWIDGLTRIPGLRRARLCLPWAQRRTRSPKETAMRLIWHHDLALPAPLCNWPIADLEGASMGSPDLFSPELAVVGQYDGADHRTLRRQSRDAWLDDWAREMGLEVFRITGAEIHRPDVVAERIARTVERAQASQRPRTFQWHVDPPWP